VPLLVLGSLVLLVLFIAVVRAAASARGALCFLSKLGIQIGEGCGTPAVRSSSGVAAALSDLVEVTPRVKDVAGSSSSSGSKSADGGAAAAAAGGSPAVDKTSGGRRRLLRVQRRQQLVGVTTAWQQLTAGEGQRRSSLAGT
jgi:hypothetical protein